MKTPLTDSKIAASGEFYIMATDKTVQQEYSANYP